MCDVKFLQNNLSWLWPSKKLKYSKFFFMLFLLYKKTFYKLNKKNQQKLFGSSKLHPKPVQKIYKWKDLGEKCWQNKKRKQIWRLDLSISSQYIPIINTYKRQEILLKIYIKTFAQYCSEVKFISQLDLMRTISGLQIGYPKFIPDCHRTFRIKVQISVKVSDL